MCYGNAAWNCAWGFAAIIWIILGTRPEGDYGGKLKSPFFYVIMLLIDKNVVNVEIYSQILVNIVP